MSLMFYGCSAFNRDISQWNVEKVTKAHNIFKNCPIRDEFKPLLVSEPRREELELPAHYPFKGSTAQIPSHYKVFLREWISIENIVTKKYEHPRLLERPDDKCNQISLEKCSEQLECELYTRSTQTVECISKDRKTNFRTGTITGKTGTPFRVVESKYIDSKTDAGYYKTYYYQIMESKSNQYVLFPTGRTNPVMDDPVIQTFLKELAIRLIESNQSYCICGHSMGCVLSLNLGYLIHSIHPSYFQEKIVVIGSAPYEWLPPTIHFEKMENVLVFVACSQYTSNAGTMNIVDCFYFRGKGAHYSPYYMIYENEEKKDMYLVKYNEPFHSEEMEKEFYGNTTFTSLPSCDEQHSWEHYYNAFSRLFPLAGGKRSRKKRSRCRLSRVCFKVS